MEPTEPLWNRYGTAISLSLSLSKIDIYIGTVPAVPVVESVQSGKLDTYAENRNLQIPSIMIVVKRGTAGTVFMKAVTINCLLVAYSGSWRFLSGSSPREPFWEPARSRLLKPAVAGGFDD